MWARITCVKGLLRVSAFNAWFAGCRQRNKQRLHPSEICEYGARFTCRRMSGSLRRLDQSGAKWNTVSNTGPCSLETTVGGFEAADVALLRPLDGSPPSQTWELITMRDASGRDGRRCMHTGQNLTAYRATRPAQDAMVLLLSGLAAMNAACFLLDAEFRRRCLQ